MQASTKRLENHNLDVSVIARNASPPISIVRTGAYKTPVPVRLTSFAEDLRMSTSFKTLLLIGIVLAATLNTDAFVILQDENTTDHSGHHHLGGPEDVDALFPLLLNDTDSLLPISANDNETDVGLGAQPSPKVDVVLTITTDDGMTPGTDGGLFTPTTSDDVHTLPTETDNPHGASGVPGLETSTGLDFPTGGVVTEDFPTGGETENFPNGGVVTEDFPTGGVVTDGFPTGGVPEQLPTLPV